MKKFITVALVALLAVTSVFAAFTGKVSTNVGYWYDDGKAVVNQYGFKNGTPAFTLTFDATSGSGEKKGEENFHAEFGGAFAVQNAKTTESGESPLNVTFKDAYFNLVWTEQEVTLNLLGTPGLTTYASSWTANDDGDADDLTNEFFNQAKGITVTWKGHEFGAGLWGEGKKVDGSFTYASADFLADEALTLNAAFGAGKKNGTGLIDLNAGVNFAYAQQVEEGEDALTAGIAVDTAFDVPTDKAAKFNYGVDVAANVAYSGASLDAYYATEAVGGILAAPEKNFYAINLGLNVADFVEKVPVSFGFQFINLKENKGEIGATVGSTLLEEALSLKANGGYTFGAEGGWNAGFNVSYKNEEVILGTVKAGFSLEDSLKTATTTLSYESSKMIDGATIGLAWNTSNLAAKEPLWGSVVASISAEF